MLLLKPNCECCNKDLPPESDEALICSFECTFCEQCMSDLFAYRCPNCDGEVSVRPARSNEYLEKNPPSTKRILSNYEINITNGAKTIVRHLVS